MRASILGVLVGLSFGLAFGGSGPRHEGAYAESNREYTQINQRFEADPELNSTGPDATGLTVERGRMAVGGLAQSGVPRDRPRAVGPEQGSLIALTTAALDGQQHLVVIDPFSRSLVTYHVDATNGQVSLKCVRDIRWDLQLDEFNGTEPTPDQIKALLRAR